MQQPPLGALEVLELPAPLDRGSRSGSSHLAVDPLLGLGDERADVAAADVGLDDDPPLAPLALDGRGAGRSRPGGRAGSSGRRSPDAVGIEDLLQGAAGRRGRTSGSRTTSGNRRPGSMDLADRRCRPAASTTSSTCSRRDAVAGERLAGRPRPARTGRPVICSVVDVGGARDRLRGPRSISAAFAFRTSRSSPKSLTPRSARMPATISLIRSSIGWREDRPHARAASRVDLGHRRDQLVLGLRPLPALAGLERDEDVGELEAHRVGGDLGRAGPAPDRARSRRGTPPGGSARSACRSASDSSRLTLGEPDGVDDDRALVRAAGRTRSRGVSPRSGRRRP